MHILKAMEAAFYQSELDQPHPARARAIIKAHPEVRQLMERNPYTAVIALRSYSPNVDCISDGETGFWLLVAQLLIAYCVGAFANHATTSSFMTRPIILFSGARAGTKWSGSSLIFPI